MSNCKKINPKKFHGVAEKHTENFYSKAMLFHFTSFRYWSQGQKSLISYLHSCPWFSVIWESHSMRIIHVLIIWKKYTRKTKVFEEIILWYLIYFLSKLFFYIVFYLFFNQIAPMIFSVQIMQILKLTATELYK